MLQRIRQLMNQVSRGDTSKLNAIDMEFENLVKEGSDADLEIGMKMLEDFLFAESRIDFQETEEDDGKIAA